MLDVIHTCGSACNDIIPDVEAHCEIALPPIHDPDFSLEGVVDVRGGSPGVLVIHKAVFVVDEFLEKGYIIFSNPPICVGVRKGIFYFVP
ncbi:hypothetical protein [Methanomethylophilus alvi]|uniref:hypothetical protein n=1 Tax=Methanomethylophilus alvi TaxID=1291540 RepID=UPI0037DDA121